MREILFRGKRTDNDKWVEGYHYILDQKHYIIPQHLSSLLAIQVIPETVGQYTGLNDKNGKQIFEGDIVTGELFRSTKGVVRWEAEMFKIGPISMCTYFGMVTVISNIHDNFELMEV